MYRYRIRVIVPKQNGQFHISQGMEVILVMENNEDPLLYNNGEEVQNSFMSKYGVDLRALRALNRDYLEVLPATDEYEEKQITLIETWEKKEPSIVHKVGGVVTKPIAWLINKIIPQKVIQGILNICLFGGKFIADKGDIIRDGKVNDIEELRGKSLRLSDQLADNVHNWAIGLASAEGAVAGVGGIFGLAVDIPAMITLAYRTMFKIGYCYGYTLDSYEDKQFLNLVMSAACADTLPDKIMALGTLQQMKVLITKVAFRKMAEKAAGNKLSKEGVVIAMRQLAAKLGTHLTRRKMLQAVPFVGGAVGAAMNAEFINDVAWAARRMFQKRWLEDNNKFKK